MDAYRFAPTGAIQNRSKVIAKHWYRGKTWSAGEREWIARQVNVKISPNFIRQLREWATKEVPGQVIIGPIDD